MNKYKLISAPQTINSLNGTELESAFYIDDKSNFYSSWPDTLTWKRSINAVNATLGSLLPARHRETLENDLNDVAVAFNEILPINEKTFDSEYLHLLLFKIQNIEKELFNSHFPVHLSLPYFVPTFTLHIAIIQAFDLYMDKHEHGESAIQFIFNSAHYLNNALNCAYHTRFNEISLVRCGPYNKLAFVQDNKTSKPLSESHLYNNNLYALKAIQNKHAHQSAVQYTQGIDFSVAQRLVDDAMAIFELNNSTDDSYSVQSSAHKQLAVWKEKQSASLHNEHLALYDEPIWVADDKDGFDYVKEYYSTVAIAMIGDLPIPGAATLSAVTGLFVSWLMPDQASKWKKYAEAIGNYIDQQLTAQELNDIENELVVAEKEFDAICKFLEENSDGWQLGEDFPDPEIEQRFIVLIYNIKETRQRIFNPNCALHNTFPYFDRLFTLYGSIIGSATVSLNSYNTYEEFQDFYTDARDYLHNAVQSAVDYRVEKLRGDYGGASNVSRMYDGQSSSFYSDKRPLNGSSNRWDGYYALQAYLDVELGYVYPNRLKLLAGLNNFDKFSKQYNDFWASKNPDHVMIQPLSNEWAELIDTKRGEANGKRSTIDSGYSHWSNGPGVQHNLYFGEHTYRSHLLGPRLYKEDSGVEGMYVPLQDYPTFKGTNPIDGSEAIIIPIENFNKLEISPCYSVTVYSEENFEGSSHTFSNGGNKFSYLALSSCGFSIKSLSVSYTKGY